MSKKKLERLTKITKEFCDTIEAEWLYCKDDSFGFMSINGNPYRIYWDEFDEILNSVDWEIVWKQR